MKSPRIQLQREFVLLAGVTLLALGPLFFLWRKSAVSQIPAMPSSPSALRPVIKRMELGKNSSISSAGTLSPDARWIARMELSASELGVERPPNALSPMADEIVIRSASTGREAFRALASGTFVGWIPNSISFVSLNGDTISVFAPAVRKPGAPPPTQPWDQTMIAFNADPGGIATTMGSNGSTSFHLQSGAIVFSPDFRFAVKGSWSTGTIVWEVADLTTGKIAPPMRTGRWLGHDPNVGGFSDDISIAVAPASLASGGAPLVAVLQTTQLPPKVSLTPTPTPNPTPTPAPTPTYSPAQSQFKAKEAKENAEIQALVESVLGVDGADPQVTDEEEIARITAEVKRRNKALDDEKQRLFPLSQVAPIPTPIIPSLPSTKPFQLECFDLGTGKRRWISSVQTQIFEPQMKFSPDGTSLVTWGTAVTRRRDGNSTVENSGIEFRAARTRRLVKKIALLEGDFSIPDLSQIGFYEDATAKSQRKVRSVLVVKDSFSGVKLPTGEFQPYARGTVLRFFDAPTAREIGHLKLDSALLPTGFQQSSPVSTSQTGLVWLVGSDDLFVLRRYELGKDVLAPMPTPTHTAPPVPMR